MTSVSLARPQGGDFSERKSKGYIGEQLYGRYFDERGWLVLQTAEVAFPHHGAELFGQELSNFLPDLHVSKDGLARLKEVKTKTKPTFYDKTKRDQHGIDREPILGYLAIERHYGIPVDLCVYEQNSELMLCAPVAWLLSLIPDPPDGEQADWLGAREGWMGTKPMFYWDREHFSRAEYFESLRYDKGDMDELVRRYL